MLFYNDYRRRIVCLAAFLYLDRWTRVAPYLDVFQSILAPTAMYHSGKNPLRKVTYKSDEVNIVKGERQRRLHKAFLRYHDPKNWPLLREALKDMGRADLIGNGKQHLIPTYQPASEGYQSARRKNSTPPGSPKAGRVLTQHTGLPPREAGGPRPARRKGRTGTGPRGV